MRILVVDEIKAEREAFARLLEGRHHLVEPVNDGKAALSAFSREPAHVVLFVGPTSAAVDLVRKLRLVQGTDHAYFVAVVESTAPGDATNLFAAGVDDVLRKACIREELVPRAEAPMRIRKYAACLLKSVAYDLTSRVDLKRIRAYQESAAIVSADVSQILGEPVNLVEGAPTRAAAGGYFSATIPMSCVNEGIELRISIVVDGVALKAIAAALLGPDADELAKRDILRELANTAGGALKRAFAVEKVILTTGLPVDDVKAPAPSESTRWWTAPLSGAGAMLALACELRDRPNQRVAASALREGMVLVRDLRNESGALLVAAGTRLTATSAERVSRVLGGGLVVEVACTAA